MSDLKISSIALAITLMIGLLYVLVMKWDTAMLIAEYGVHTAGDSMNDSMRDFSEWVDELKRKKEAGRF